MPRLGICARRDTMAGDAARAVSFTKGPPGNAGTTGPGMRP
jgi:hypothetical protein